jgi:hypothetical protein
VTGDQGWYTVRCVFRRTSWEGRPFEERITLWRAESLDDAIELAEREARTYADETGVEYLLFSQAYQLSDGAEPGNGTEVFSLLRDSELAPRNYIDTVFSTGREHTGEL